MGLKKRKNGGFTMVEMLVAAAILMILMALGFVEIVKQSRYLKVTEMDNMARSIYLAAENRAVVLARSGRLTEESLSGNGGSLTAAPGSASNLYYIKSPGANIADLIPAGTIEPTLRDASFYIVYDIAAGCVKDVFFDETTSGENFAAAFSPGVYPLSGPDGFETFYQYWSRTDADKSRQTRADNKIYIGHYGGEAAVPPMLASTSTGSAGPIRVKPEITIDNGEELKLYVKYKPENDPKINGWKLEVKITYENMTVTLPFEKGVQPSGSDTWTYILDAVKGPYFKDLWWKKPDGTYMTNAEKIAAGAPTSLGGVFQVTAKMVEKADSAFTGERANVIAIPAILRKTNSLFDDATTSGNKAIIANLRHLQNLDEAFSGVTNKTEAHIIADIEVDKLKDNNGNVIDENYKFSPIHNSQLKLFQSYNVQKDTNGDGVPDTGDPEKCYTIKNLTVTSESSNGKSGAGLFADVSGTPAEPFRFVNVWLDNASVNGGNKPTGSIAGTATNATFTGCRVYWTDTAKLEQDGKVVYKIQGGNGATGGLVGALSGGSIKDSFAATTIQGNGQMGGLVGNASDVKIEKAYADCYLKGESAGLRAGGLIGSASGNTTLTNVYSSGFIEWTNTDKNSVVAGFCAEGSVTAKNAYSGVYYQATGDYAHKLAGGNALAFGSSVTLLDKYYAAWGNGGSSGYEGLKSLSLGSAFESKDNAKNSFPYRLGNNAGLGNYEAPGIKGLPHYGDWANGNQGGLPIVWVVNGEELLAKIQVKGDNIPYVKLYYGDKEVGIPAGSMKKGTPTIISATESEVVWTVTLDSLHGPHFKDWWTIASSPPSSFGGDFSVVASTDNSTWTKKSAKSSGNSLFASGSVIMKDDNPVSLSGGATAYIENLRHLQNLDWAISNVTDYKTAAVQTKNINGGGYEFKPITNKNLQSYTVREKTDASGKVLRGEYCEIRNLKVTGASSAGKKGAGLFAEVASTTIDSNLVPFRFENVSLKGAEITSGSTTIPAGALAGTTNGSVTFTNCQVTGSSTVTGKGSVGGLIGKATTGTGTVTFTDCTGSGVTVQADGQADARGFGGLAGYVDGTVRMNNCRMDGATVKNASVTVSGGVVAAGNTEGGFRDCIGGLVGYVTNKAEFTGCSIGLTDMVNAWSADCASTIGSQDPQTVFVGGMAGYVGGSFQADGCKVVQAALRGTGNRSAVGGLTGFTKSAVITGCTVGDAMGETGMVAIDSSSNYEYPDYTTGITGGTIKQASYNKLSGQVGSGGMIGYATGNVILSGCEVVGDVFVKGYKTADHVGGFVGYATNVTGEMLAGCKIRASATKKPTMESGAGGSAVGAGHVGGMVGFAQPNLTMTDCTAESIIVRKNADNVAGLRGIGGLVGCVGTMRYQEIYNNQKVTIDADGKATLTGCSITGSTSVTGKGFRNRVGGLVGYATAADFRGCEVVSGTDRVSVQGLFETMAASNAIAADNKIKNELEKDDTVFVGGMIGSSASDGSGGATTTFDKSTNGNVCKVVSTDVSGQGPRACVGGIMGLANQTTFTNCIVGMAGDTPSVTVAATSLNNKEDINNNTGGIGGIAGYANNAVTFTDCTVINTKIGKDMADYEDTDRFDAGGILGSAQKDGTFIRCRVGGDAENKKVIVNGTRFTGGIAGFVAEKGTFTECKVNQAAVNSVHISESAAGGVLGKGTGDTTMDKCTVSSTMVDAKNSSGGTSSDPKRAAAGGIAGELIGTSTNQIEVKMTGCTVSSVTTTATSVATGGGTYMGNEIGYKENVKS